MSSDSMPEGRRNFIKIFTAAASTLAGISAALTALGSLNHSHKKQNSRLYGQNPDGYAANSEEYQDCLQSDVKEAFEQIKLNLSDLHTSPETAVSKALQDHFQTHQENLDCAHTTIQSDIAKHQKYEISDIKFGNEDIGFASVTLTLTLLAAYMLKHRVIDMQKELKSYDL